MNVEKVYLSWEDIEKHIDNLTKTLSTQKFDAVLSIGRGGMIPACMLAQKLDIHTAYVLDIKAYSDEPSEAGKVKISDLIIDKNVHNILVVDDCIFTGLTLNHTIQQLTMYENIENITVAFLYKNKFVEENPQHTYVFSEEYDGNKYWLVFPWENI